MPIKRLSNQEPAFPKIGTLRKGAPKPNDKQPGKDLTYFRFDTPDPEAQADFEAAYGKTPASVNVYLPYPTTDENFSVWQEEYRAGGLVHRCDGETMTVHLLPNGMYSTEPKPCPYHGKQTDRNTGCKPVGRLSVIVPELKRFAYVTVGTNSINDIMELTANLNAVVAMRGSLQGVPMVLTRRPEKISTPDGKGGRVRYEKWMLHIEPDPAWVRVQLDGMRINALLPAGAKLLTDGRTITQDGEIIEDDGDGYWETEEPKQLTANGHKPAPVTIPGAALLDENGEPYEPLDYTSDDNSFRDGPAPSPTFSSGPEAHRWAVAEGYCQNEYEARKSWMKIVNERFGGKVQPANVQDVIAAFVARQLEKAAA